MRLQDKQLITCDAARVITISSLSWVTVFDISGSMDRMEYDMCHTQKVGLRYFRGKRGNPACIFHILW